MAESLVSNVVSQLDSLLLQKAVSLGGVRHQIEWVKAQLELLQGFLEDADSRRKRGDARMEIWIRQMRGVAYEIEDVIGSILYMGERRHQRRGFMGSISRYSHKPRELITLHKIGSEIGKIVKKIDGITKSRATYGIANLGDDDIDVIGFENDKKALVSRLLDGNEKARRVISIVGMSGLGKTTLAREVYNDREIRKHFDTFAWVSVSQSYRGIELVKDIMEKVMGIKKKKEDLEQMGEEEVKKTLRDFLGDKKYLVVMDDIWRVDVWREMQPVFSDENKGSRILLTTCEMEVAYWANSSFPPHKLHTLNDTHSLELLCRKAFPPKQDVPADLKELAQTLVKKCGGLPLALVVLGGLLSWKVPSYDTWLKVAQSMNWVSTGDGKECHKILGLSYTDLPSQLKPCFLYIAAFPEDSIISVSKLVRLWVAEGFITQKQRQTMEDTARDWLDELVQRCMIQVVERSWAGGPVKSIRIHDLLRNFGLEEAKKDEFLQVCSRDNMAVSDGISSHRAAFYRINEEVVVFSRHLRTLLGFSLILTNEGRFLNGLNLLRVLDLEGARDLEELPKQIGSMIHIRYLGLRDTGLKRLPSSIRHLLNLQTMDVRETQILWIPKSFWKIRTLRHVYININMFLSATISGDHKNLQTLQIEEFELADSPIPGDVLFARAPNLHQLRSLKLDGKLVLKQQQQLPDCSQFLPNLTKVKLSITQLEHDPMPVLEKLPSLSFLEVEINAFVGKIMLCSAGGFHRLQHLILESLPNLEEWRVEAGAMPSLTHLTIWNCKKLKMLPEGLQHVTTLRELKLNLMPREFNDRVRNEDAYKVQHIPSIIFQRELQ